MKKVALVLVNIRSAQNVGSILRSADCFGVNEVIFVGYTPYPKLVDDTRLPHMADKITKRIHKTALGAEVTMPMAVFTTINESIGYLKAKGYQIAALEQSNQSQNINQLTMQQSIALLLGNEVTGLPEAVLKLCDIILEIPQYGLKESLNVAAASAIALYAIRNQE